MPVNSVFLQNQLGDVYEVSPQDAPGLLQQGLAVASPEAIQTHQLKQNRDNLGEAIATGAEGAADALTFGGSTLIERGLSKLGVPGMTPEDIMRRKEQHPFAHAIGFGAGIAAPLILTGGAAAPAEAGALTRIAGKTAPSLIAKAGQAAVKLLPGAEQQAAKGLLARAVESGLGSAVEGALYGGQEVLDEAILGDPNLTATGALRTIGLTSLTMGGLGSIGTLGADVAGRVAKKTAQAGAKLLGNWTDAKMAAEEATYARPSLVKKLLHNESDREEIVGRWLSREENGAPIWGPTTTPEELAASADRWTAEAGQKMQDVLSNSAETTDFIREGKHDDIMLGVKERLFRKLNLPTLEGGTVETAEQAAKRISESDQFLRELATNPAQQAAWADFQKVLRGYDEKLNGYFQPGDLHLMRRQVSERARGYSGVLSPDATAAREAFERARIHTSEAIEEYMDAVSKEFEKSRPYYEAQGIGPNALENPVRAWNEANQEWRAAHVLSELAHDGIDRFHGGGIRSTLWTLAAGTIGTMTHGLGGGAIAGGAAHYLTENVGKYAPAFKVWGLQKVNQIGFLAGFERAAQEASIRTNTLVGRLVRGSGETARQWTASAVASWPDERVQREYAKQSGEVSMLAANPQEFLDRLNSATTPLTGHLPKTGAALQETTARAVAYLDMMKPKPRTPASVFALGWSPTRQEAEQWLKLKEIVEDPTIIIGKAANGTLTKAEVDAVQYVHPHYLQEVRTRVLSEAFKNPKQVPYSSMQGIGVLIGQPVDFASQNVLAFQGVYAGNRANDMQQAAAMAAAQGTKPNPGAGHIKMSERANMVHSIGHGKR